MILLILHKLIKTYQNRFFYYHRLLLERYMYQYKFNKIKKINNSKSFYRDKYHYINFLNEDEYLKRYFNNH